jgi:hypothetical protein
MEEPGPRHLRPIPEVKAQSKDPKGKGILLEPIPEESPSLFLDGDNSST